MPNRIIKESICVSEEIDKLSWFEEILFYRLMVNCDDFGRFDGRIPVIKNRLFPLKEKLTNTDVCNGIQMLSSVGLIQLYETDGKPYIQVTKWLKHQNKRATKSKYPEPETFLNTDDINCNQEESNVPVLDTRIRTRNSILDTRISEEQAPLAAVEPLPLNDGTLWLPTQSEYEEYLRLYPAVDIKQEFRNMRGWCNDNPQRRKTEGGIKRFVGNWLSKEQNNPRKIPARQQKGEWSFDDFR